jgi:hypothetical protein
MVMAIMFNHCLNIIVFKLPTVIHFVYVMLQNINTVVNFYKNKYGPAVVTITSFQYYRDYNIIVKCIGSLKNTNNSR